MEDMCTPWSATHDFTMPGVTFTGRSLVSFATICPTFTSVDGTPAAPHEDEHGQMTSALEHITDSEKATWILQALRITTHEICHILGLRHCLHFQCLMNPGNQRCDDLGGGMFLCPLCLRKLCFVLSLSGVEPSAPSERYRAMLAVLQEVSETFSDAANRAAQATAVSRQPQQGRQCAQRHRKKTAPDPESTSTTLRHAVSWLEQRLRRLEHRREATFGGA